MLDLGGERGVNEQSKKVEMRNSTKRWRWVAPWRGSLPNTKSEQREDTHRGRDCGEHDEEHGNELEHVHGHVHDEEHGNKHKQ